MHYSFSLVETDISFPHKLVSETFQKHSHPHLDTKTTEKMNNNEYLRQTLTARQRRIWNSLEITLNNKSAAIESAQDAFRYLNRISRERNLGFIIRNVDTMNRPGRERFVWVEERGAAGILNEQNERADRYRGQRDRLRVERVGLRAQLQRQAETIAHRDARIRDLEVYNEGLRVVIDAERLDAEVQVSFELDEEPADVNDPGILVHADNQVYDPIDNTEIDPESEPLPESDEENQVSDPINANNPSTAEIQVSDQDSDSTENDTKGDAEVQVYDQNPNGTENDNSDNAEAQVSDPSPNATENDTSDKIEAQVSDPNHNDAEDDSNFMPPTPTPGSPAGFRKEFFRSSKLVWPNSKPHVAFSTLANAGSINCSVKNNIWSLENQCSFKIAGSAFGKTSNLTANAFGVNSSSANVWGNIAPFGPEVTALPQSDEEEDEGPEPKKPKFL